MNIFGLDINRLDPDGAREALSGYPVERLPGVPPFLSKKECAAILGVSMKVINHLTESGELPAAGIPGDSPAQPGLFDQPAETGREIYILRADLVSYLEKTLLCNKPVLDPIEDR